MDQPLPPRGSLRVFLGYAAGTGKTYAMLKEAQKLLAEGENLFVAYLEPHERPATLALAEGLPQLKPRVVEYKGIVLNELDLKVALDLPPGTHVVVDELAHTNPPGSSHPKRWQDVQELLDKGLHVLTTLNIQHLESAVDLVFGATGIQVSEKVPDSFIDSADELRLIDLSPEDLLQRLAQGKIYPRDGGKRALANFFLQENLTALRELLLRKVLQRAGQETRSLFPSKRTEASPIAVAIGPAPSSAQILRKGYRMAQALQVPLEVLYVRRPGDDDPTIALGIEKNFQLARDLGAHLHVMEGLDPTEEILSWTRSRGIGRLLVGRPGKRTATSLGKKAIEKLLADAGDMDVFLIPSSTTSLGKKPSNQRSRVPLGTGKRGRSGLKDHLISALAYLGSLALAITLDFLGMPESTLVLVLLSGVILGSLTQGFRGSIVLAIASTLAFNWFFTEPRGTFMINNPGYILSFLVFLAFSMGTAGLMRRLQGLKSIAEARARRSEAHNRYLQQVVAATSVEAIKTITLDHLTITTPGQWYWISSEPEQESWDGWSETEKSALAWCFSHGTSSGNNTGNFPGSSIRFFPVVVETKVLAVLGWKYSSKERLSPADEALVIPPLLNTLELFLEAEDHKRSLIKEQLQVTWLRGLSHDLRTPVSAISALVERLTTSNQGKEELLKLLGQETKGLGNLLDNLLAWGKAQIGDLRENTSWELLEDILHQAVRGLHALRPSSHWDLQVKPESLVVKVPAHLVVLILRNLLDNALKYSPPETTIRCKLEWQHGQLLITVEDEGPGIPLAAREQVFQLGWVGGQVPPDGRKPLGLGMAVVKGLVTSMGGTISIHDSELGGSKFIIALPAEGREVGNLDHG